MLTDFWQDVTAFGSLVFSIALIAGAYAIGEPALSFQLLVALILCYTISFPIKIFFFKQRPKKERYGNLIEKFEASSFPSVHSMRAVSLAIILAVFANNLLFTLLEALVVIGTLYSRILLRKHFLVHVVWGALFGAVIGHAVSLSPLLLPLTSFL